MYTPLPRATTRGLAERDPGQLRPHNRIPVHHMRDYSGAVGSSGGAFSFGSARWRQGVGDGDPSQGTAVMKFTGFYTRYLVLFCNFVCCYCDIDEVDSPLHRLLFVHCAYFVDQTYRKIGGVSVFVQKILVSFRFVCCYFSIIFPVPNENARRYTFYSVR